MVAPVENIRHRAGRASLEVQLVSGESAVTSSYATNPLKLLTPRSRGRSIWACTSSFGGGLVAGDQTSLDLRIGSGARCFLGTQASTKIYRNPAALPSGHETHATLDSSSLLVFAPDPVQAFAGSTYTQRQEFHLASDASLVLLDWFTSGRAARGERWEFNQFQSRNAVWCERNASRSAEHCSVPECGVDAASLHESTAAANAASDVQTTKTGHRAPSPLNGERAGVRGEPPPDALKSELIFFDSLMLTPGDGSLIAPHRMGRFDCFATLLLIGPALQEAASHLIEIVSKEPVTRRANLIASASPVGGGAVFRIAGEHVEAVGHELHLHLVFLRDLLGDDPWVRKW